MRIVQKTSSVHEFGTVVNKRSIKQDQKEITGKVINM